MTYWYCEPLAVYAEEKVLASESDSSYSLGEAVTQVLLTSEYGDKKTVPFNIDEVVSPTRNYPSIEQGDTKLIWVISSDANWNGLDEVKILTLDLSTMSFSLSYLSELLSDEVLKRDLDGGTTFDIELRNQGNSLLFTVKDVYGNEQITSLFDWGSGKWGSSKTHHSSCALISD
ncbi:hypothetical protein [Vibrio agarivorans]|uniref:Uncharacterized protein n=1 Tax=Vibrio agarivorans TaxID=153622 RepID=A0ABT7Y5U8_9VIBR|nr:hypothetical protein [Vibrio agarivorans]MDN2483431.1 hypothetical protein [Vibrio agarivorans]